jgi:hypothetical protein
MYSAKICIIHQTGVAGTMIEDQKLLLVGGAGRNVGKTEFVCRLIQKIAKDHCVYALKVSAIFPDERLYHGDHASETEGNSLFPETDRGTSKDTSRMLRAGATGVFYLRSDGASIPTHYETFRRKIPADALVVCESNSLGQFVNPSLYIMVKSLSGEIKPRAIPQLERADLVVVSDGISGFPELAGVEVVQGVWSLQE